jgi:hypothetical protein
MKIRALRRRQGRLSRGEPGYLDRYLNRADRRYVDRCMAGLQQALRKSLREVDAFLSQRAYAKRFS